MVGSVNQWLLCDYGQVLSTAPPADEWEALRKAAGEPDGDEFHTRYWEHRPAYDRADVPAPEYWCRVLGEEPDEARMEELFRWDVAMWLHPHEASVAAALRAAARGFRLAILSNAPVEVAGAIDSQPWLAPFEPRYYSCDLRAIKPEPAAYAQVLAGLDAQPEQVVFFDDRPDNVTAAEELGIRAVLYTDPAQFDALH